MKTFLKSLIVLFAISSVALGQTPATSPKVPSVSSPETSIASDPATKTTTTAPSPATTTKTTTTSTAPSADEMKQMMELAKLNENHKLLASMAGTWSYTVKMYAYMDASGKPAESTGTAVRKAVMDGRYVTGDHSGKFEMPGPDGKMMKMDFKGMSMDGYDNVKRKFVSGWVDTMGTGILILEGAYDAATKTFTYTGEYEESPGKKIKIREVIKITDDKHHTMEYFCDRTGQEAKEMEIAYTRKK